MKVFNIISLISFITILGLSLSLAEINVNQVLGQTSTQTNFENATDTFSMDGAISSLVFVSDATTDNGTSWKVSDDKKFILSGYWDLAANNGTITKFYVNFTKVLSDLILNDTAKTEIYNLSLHDDLPLAGAARSSFR